MNPVSRQKIKNRPWGWIPSIYMAEGLPYAVVNIMTATMYTNLAIPKATMAFYTGLIGLPWILKPFWSPFIDLIRTKRWWTLLMQGLMCLGMFLIGAVLPTSNFFITSIIIFWGIAFLSATHDVAADGYYMMALNEQQQAAFVGVRSTVYKIASLIGQGGLLIVAGLLETSFADIPKAWSVTFIILGFLFLIIFLWDLRMMPMPEKDRPIPGVTSKKIAKDFLQTFVTFFQRRHIWIALLFMILYRLPEALCLKIVPPFLLDSKANGGLALTTAQAGTANGIVGVVALLVGGIVGGLAIAKGGLKKWLWPMALALTLPCIVYLLFALYQPSEFYTVCIGIGLEQFGYGFGYTAIMMYLIYFCVGENQTSHFAFCTAFMLLGIIGPGMVAGWLFEQFELLGAVHGMSTAGYIIFFSFVMISCLVSFISVSLVRPTIKATENSSEK